MTGKLKAIYYKWLFKKLLLGKKGDSEAQFYRDCEKFNLIFNK